MKPAGVMGTQIVVIENTQLMHNRAGSVAMIQVFTNGELKINNSTFEDNFSIGRGSIIQAEGTNSISIIENSRFIGNYAYTGGVFFTELNGYIEVIESIF